MIFLGCAGAGEPPRATASATATFAATLLIGTAMTILADPGWILALGVLCLVARAIATFGLATTGPDHDW